jgi:hypothetical protein
MAVGPAPSPNLVTKTRVGLKGYFHDDEGLPLMLADFVGHGDVRIAEG